jgi:hypothetical protein
MISARDHVNVPMTKDGQAAGQRIAGQPATSRVNPTASTRRAGQQETTLVISSSQVMTTNPLSATIAPYQNASSPAVRMASGNVLTYCT